MPFSLTQARVLYELGGRTGVRSTHLIRELGLDPGYPSRLLKGLERQRLIKRTSSRDDRRVSLLALTAKGRAEFESLNTRSEDEITGMLAAMSGAQRKRLVGSMTAIRQLLEPCRPVEPAFVLRTHRPGDIGWVVARHGERYAREYRWDSSFEGLVAKIAGEFLAHLDDRHERCWIAERNGEPIGFFVVKQSESPAKLRLLLVEPSARIGCGHETRG